jgi:hypothetical protein
VLSERRKDEEDVFLVGWVTGFEREMDSRFLRKDNIGIAIIAVRWAWW